MSVVLVIDDEPLVRKTIRLTLERSGHRVLEACDGRDGERAFAAEHVDLVVTDVLMPDQEGIETIRNLRRTDPGVRILAMSGGGRTKNQEFLELAMKLGATATIAKPFDLAEFTRAVDRLCCTDPATSP